MAIRYEVTETNAQDLEHRTLCSDDLMAAELHGNRYPQGFLNALTEEFHRSHIALNGGLGRGRLTGVGQVSTGGGGVNIVVTGEALIPAGWAQAKATIACTGANNDVVWEAIAPGAEGNGIIVEYVDNAGATAVDWTVGTRTITVGLNITGAGDTVANILTALAASASGAQYVVQARAAYGNTTAGTIDETATATLSGGTGTAMSRATLTRADGANADLHFEAVDYGADAKTVSVSYVHDAALATAPTVVVTETETAVGIVITAVIGTQTANQILRSLWDSADAMEWVHVRLADGQNGTGTPTALAATALAAPHGTDGFHARVGNIDANVRTFTDSGLTFDCAAGVGTAGDTVEFVLSAGGIEHRASAAVVA